MKKMRNIIIIIFISLIFVQCSNNNTEQKETTKIDISTKDTNNSEQQDEPKRTIIEKKIVDFDDNGINDTLIIENTYDPYYFTAIINSQRYNYEYPSVCYDTVKSEGIQRNNLIKSKFFVVFKNNKNKKMLYIKDRGDYAGPVNLIYGFVDNVFLELFNVEGEEPIEIFSDSISTYLVLKEISYEPGFEKDYWVIEYPKFKLYIINNNKIEFDSLVSVNYNIENNKDFVKYLEMKKPVLGKKKGTNDKFELIDLDKI